MQPFLRTIGGGEPNDEAPATVAKILDILNNETLRDAALAVAWVDFYVDRKISKVKNDAVMTSILADRQ